MRSRSRVLGVLLPGLLALASLGVAACGSSSKSSTTSSSGGGSSSSSNPTAGVTAEVAKFKALVNAPAGAKKGGTLTLIGKGDVDYIDPGASYYQPALIVHWAADSPLMGWPPNDTAAPVPVLASRQPVISNGACVRNRAFDNVQPAHLFLPVGETSLGCEVSRVSQTRGTT